MTKSHQLTLWLVVFALCKFAATDCTCADNIMPEVPPTVEEVLQANEELAAESDFVAHLKVESVDRLMSYGGVCIEVHSSWYLARCRVVKKLHGAVADDTKTVDVIFWTKTDATVLGFHLPPERRERDGFSNQITLARRQLAEDKNEPFEIVAFLRHTPAVHPLRPKDVPKLFAPVRGYGEPGKALTSIGRYKIVERIR